MLLYLFNINNKIAMGKKIHLKPDSAAEKIKKIEH